jgi:thioredoxin 1
MNNKIPNKGVVLVDFWAPWCGPCRNMLPILEKLQQDIKQDFTLIKINVDQASDDTEIQGIVQEHKIRSIPTLVLYKDGVLIETLHGTQKLETLTSLVNKAVSS